MTGSTLRSTPTVVPPLREAAITLHVMYEELKLAGFSRREALFPRVKRDDRIAVWAC
jgi:hypothetical protein